MKSILILLLLCKATYAAVGGDNTLMADYSAVIPLTLEERVMRLVAFPPDGVEPEQISCDIGVTGTVLSNARGTYSSEAGQSVVRDLKANDEVDVVFSDRYQDRHADMNGTKYEHQMDFYIGLKVKYVVKEKVAQVEIRGVYSLPSGQLQALTYQRALQERRVLEKLLDKCCDARDSCPGIRSDIAHWQNLTNTDNHVNNTLAGLQVGKLQTQLGRAERQADKIPSVQRDLDAFDSIDEYLKVKIHGMEIYVRFYADGKTIPVNADELKKRKIIPIRVAGNQ